MSSILFNDLPNHLKETAEGFWVAEKASKVGAECWDESTDFLEVEADSFWHEHRNRCLLTVCQRFVPGGRLWDVGGGTGIVSDFLKKNGILTGLIEPQLRIAQMARKRGVNPVIATTFEAAVNKTSVLDAAALCDVLEHIEDDVAFLQSLKTCLKPGGYLYLTVPAYGWLWSSRDEGSHFRRYHQPMLRKALTSAGFKIDYISYFFSWLPPVLLATRVLPDKLGLTQNSTSHYYREHSPKKKIIRSIGLKAFQWELSMIRQGRSIPFGASLLAVASAPR